MDILDKIAQTGGERSGSLSKNRIDFQLHFAMCLFFAEYLSDKDRDFQIILDYNDDISIIKDNKVSCYQVKTSEIEQVLSEKILSGTHSDYVVNLYKHVHLLGTKGIEGLYLISNLKITQGNSLLKEVSLNDFSEQTKNELITLIKKKYQIEIFQKGFLVLTKIQHTEMPLNDYVPYVQGKILKLFEEDMTSLSYNPIAIYRCIKEKFDEKNNFEQFSKIIDKKTLLRYKGIESKFLKDLILTAKSNIYNNSQKKYEDFLEKNHISIQEQRSSISGLTRVKSRLLSRDKATLILCQKVQDFVEKHEITELNIETIKNIYGKIKMFKKQDRYDAYASIFISIEAYKKGENI